MWWDAALRSGETFDEVIEKELRAAKAVVVLWSPRSVASRWVRAEATLADRRNKLVPAIIEACDRPIIFELTHAADLSDWTGDTSDSRWQTLVSDLRRLVDGSKDAASAQPGVAESAAKPKPVSAASATPRSADRKASRRGNPVPANADELMLAASRASAKSAVRKLARADAAWKTSTTQFYKRSDEFRPKRRRQGPLPPAA